MLQGLPLPGLGDTAQAAEPLVRALYERFATLAMLIARPLGIVTVLPVFTRAEIGRVVRTGLCIAIVLPAFGPLHAERIGHLEALRDPVLSNGALLVAMGLKEFAVGFLLGVLLSIPFWAVQAVGEVVDAQQGIAGGIDDPTTKTQGSAFGGFLLFAAIVLFVSAGGLGVVASTLYESYAVWPLTIWLPPFSLEGFVGLASLLDDVLRFAILVGAPFLIAFFLLDVGIGLLSRFAPSVSAFALLPVAKGLAFVGVLALYALFLIEYASDELGVLRDALPRLGDLLAAPVLGEPVGSGA